MAKQYTNVAEIKRAFEQNAANAQSRLKEWHAEFLTNPGYSLSWSNDMFKEAARLEVCAKVINWCNVLARQTAQDMLEEAAVAEIKEAVREEATRLASRVCESTSVTSNLSENCLRAYWMRVHLALCGEQPLW